MPATESAPTVHHERELPAVAGSTDLQLAPITTQRGTSQLSLAELAKKISHYPEETREATIAAQTFFVEHCESNIEKFMGIARNVLGSRRSSGYYSNWLKGFLFLKGGGKLKEDGKGATEWNSFCKALSEYQRKLRGETRTIVTPTIRAIEANIAEIYDIDNPCRIGGLAGPTGSQKTEGLKFVANKRGGFPYANYFDCTEGLGVNGLKRGIADLFNAKHGNRAGVIDREIGANLNFERGLFLDNIQRAVSPEDESVVVDWLLRMQEWKNFPLYLTFTKGFRNKLDGNSPIEQLVGRFGGMNEILEVSDYPTMGDLRAFARHYELADSAIEDYLKPWSRSFGRIRVMAKRLWRAKQFAKADGKDRITLDYLKEADQWVPPAELEGGAS